MVAHCLEGDGTAWETLVAKHRRRVFNIAYKFTGRHDRAEDLSQEIFLRVFKNLGKFDPSADFSKWLASVARNHCIDNYRSTRREQRTMVDDGLAFDMAVAPSTTDPLRSIEASEAPGAAACSEGIGAVTCARAVASKEPPSKGGRPAIMRKSSTPSA